MKEDKTQFKQSDVKNYLPSQDYYAQIESRT